MRRRDLPILSDHCLQDHSALKMYRARQLRIFRGRSRDQICAHDAGRNVQRSTMARAGRYCIIRAPLSAAQPRIALIGRHGRRQGRSRLRLSSSWSTGVLGRSYLRGKNRMRRRTFSCFGRRTRFSDRSCGRLPSGTRAGIQTLPDHVRSFYRTRKTVGSGGNWGWTPS